MLQPYWYLDFRQFLADELQQMLCKDGLRSEVLSMVMIDWQSFCSLQTRIGLDNETGCVIHMVRRYWPRRPDPPSTSRLMRLGDITHADMGECSGHLSQRRRPWRSRGWSSSRSCQA